MTWPLDRGRRVDGDVVPRGNGRDAARIGHASLEDGEIARLMHEPLRPRLPVAPYAVPDRRQVGVPKRVEYELTELGRQR